MRTKMLVFRCRNNNDGWVVGGPVDWICLPTWERAMECANAVARSDDPLAVWRSWTVLYPSNICHSDSSLLLVRFS